MGALIGLLTGLSALLHDIGKACDNFQSKLSKATTRVDQRSASPNLNQANEYRHEWVSLRLFQAFLANTNLASASKSQGQTDPSDIQWLECLSDNQSLSDEAWLELWTKNLVKDGMSPNADKSLPFIELAPYPIGAAIGWLVVSHHRLPTYNKDLQGRGQLLTLWPRALDAYWNDAKPSDNPQTLKTYWQFEAGLPQSHEQWRKTAAKYARQILKLLSTSTLESPLRGSLCNAFEPHELDACRPSLFEPE